MRQKIKSQTRQDNSKSYYIQAGKLYYSSVEICDAKGFGSSVVQVTLLLAMTLLPRYAFS